MLPATAIGGHVNESGHGGPTGRVGTGRRVPGDGLRL